MKKIIISIIAAVVFIGGAILLFSGGTKPATTGQNNVSIVDGKQIVEINAKGGYSPRNTNAKANMPTVIKVTTNGTFDCSAVLTIPSMKYRAFLPPSGATEIEIPTQKSGSIIKGVCAMGMYNFAIQFN